MNTRMKQGLAAGLLAAALALVAWFAVDIPFYTWSDPLERASLTTLRDDEALSFSYSDDAITLHGGEGANIYALTESLMHEVLQPSAQRGGKGSKMISFKPWNDIGQIVELAKREMTAPQYFRRMIINYCRKPLSTREQIIFKIQYDQLRQKCRERKPIVITTTWKPEILHEVIPVSMSIGHEEMFNYLLCQEINPYTNVPEARSYALRRINGISDGRTTIDLDETIEKHLREMKKKGPQYAINDDETICVRLTQKGQDYYQRIYFGRPVYSQIEEKPD